jgi:hypothetical protein
MARRPDIGFFEDDLDLLDASTWSHARLSVEQAEHINPLVYRSLTFSLLENEAIWTRDWIFIGTSDDIPDEGDLLPYTIGNHGIHVQRMADGTLEGRFNNAQHGGCRVVPQQCQSGSKTKCSFTSCGYSRDRDAISASDAETSTALMFQYVGLRPERLLRISVAQAGKLIFVNLDGPDQDFTSRAADLDADTMSAVMKDRASKQWLEIQCNWKTAGEALFKAAANIGSTKPDVFSAVLQEPDRPAEPAPVSATWLYPNLVVLRTPSAACTIGIQPTAIGKALCRIQYFADADDTGSATDLDVLAKIVARTRETAEQAHRELVSEEHLRFVDPDASRAVEPLSQIEHWAQSVLIDRLMAMPRTVAHDPMYQPLKHYLI